MRYYRIEIEGQPGRLFTSHPNGPGSPPDPGALQVELDLVCTMQAIASTNSFVRVWGIPISEISQSFDLNQKQIRIFGGMGKGLPLANPAQSGPLAFGTIYSAFANWVDTDQTLDFYLTTPSKENTLQAVETPVNLSFDWPAQTELADAIKNALSLGFPSYQIDVAIKQGLKLDRHEQGYYASLPQLAQEVKALSKDIVGPNYTGVDIFEHAGTIYARDDTKPGATKQVQFTDLIGQPTWLDLNIIQVTTVMRADIHQNDLIKLPPGTLATIGPGAGARGNTDQFANLRQASIFQGAFRVQTVRHVGNSRIPDGRAWTSVFNCLRNGASTSGQPADQTQTAPVPMGGFSSKRVPFN